MANSKEHCEVEIIAAAVNKHRGKSYLACLVEECYDDLTGYVVTLYNETDDHPVEFWTGLDDFVTYDAEEAGETYLKCLTPKPQEAA
jgi:hypothetical protein